MTHILLVRHGQTEWNRVLRFRGRADLDLDETGRKQAAAVAQRLAVWQPVAVYSSPLRRAWSTAETIAHSLGLALEVLPGLVDIDYGCLQGLSPEEAQYRYHSLYYRWQRQPNLVQFPGGESLAEVQGRASAALEALALRHPSDVVVCISHEVVCRSLLCWALGLDLSHFWQIRQDVAAINVIEFHNAVPGVTLVNDTCHLMELV